MKIENVVKLLVNKSEKKYGRNWKSYVGSALGQCKTLREERSVKSFYKKLGFAYCGSGVFRMVFSWKDIVIKIDHGGEHGNRQELTAYKSAVRRHKNFKYFMCPLLKNVVYKKKLYLVFPKIPIYGDRLGNRQTQEQQEMWGINSSLFGDIHELNIGKFCGGEVAVDLNMGFNGSGKFHIECVNDFTKGNKAFWDKYRLNFNNTVKALKKKHGVI